MKFRVGFTEYFSEDGRKFQHDVIIVEAKSGNEAMNKAQEALEAQGKHVVIGWPAEPLLATKDDK